MGIISRFSEIMSANINDFLDKFQDDRKMVDQKIRELREDYAVVKDSAAEVLAEEKARKRALDESKCKLQDYNVKAERAVQAGNDDDARILLEEVSRLEASIPDLQQNYDSVHLKATQVRQMGDKLLEDIKRCESEAAGVKSDLAMAKATNTIADAMDRAKATKSSESFDRVKERAQRKLDVATARMELSTPPVDDAANVAAKYGSAASSPDVESRLAALKAKNGMQ